MIEYVVPSARFAAECMPIGRFASGNQRGNVIKGLAILLVRIGKLSKGPEDKKK